MSSSLHELLAGGSLRYSQVWEDHALVEQGLAIAPGDDVLSIASAGCNVFAAALAGARSVVAIDLNPAQTALVELKMRAIERLSWEETIAFLGIAPSADRITAYEVLRPSLSEAARIFWDVREPMLAAGVHWGGRLEEFFAGFAKKVLPTVHDELTIERALDQDDLAAQVRTFDESFGTEALRTAFQSYFTRERIAGEGRDPRQMRYVAQMDVAGFFWQRFRWVMTALPTRGNFYLHSFLTGRYAGLDALPPYLRKESYSQLRASIPRIRLERGEIGDYLEAHPKGHISKVNLSDLFEYLSDEATAGLFESLAQRVRPLGRLSYWNLLVDRRSPAELRSTLRPLEAEGDALHLRDRSWFYRAFRVEEVVQP